MSGLIVTVRRAIAATALMAVGAGLVTGCAGGAHARKPPAAVRASASPAAIRVPASPAAARVRRLPGVYLGAGSGPWSGPKIRPRELLLGADFTIDRIRWKRWTRRHANGRGHLLACQGAGGPCVHFWGRLRVWHVRKHRGHRYFAILKMTHG